MSAKEQGRRKSQGFWAKVKGACVSWWDRVTGGWKKGYDHVATKTDEHRATAAGGGNQGYLARGKVLGWGALKMLMGAAGQVGATVAAVPVGIAYSAGRAYDISCEAVQYVYQGVLFLTESGVQVTSRVDYGICYGAKRVWWASTNLVRKDKAVFAAPNKRKLDSFAQRVWSPIPVLMQPLVWLFTFTGITGRNDMVVSEVKNWWYCYSTDQTRAKVFKTMVDLSDTAATDRFETEPVSDEDKDKMSPADKAKLPDAHMTRTFLDNQDGTWQVKVEVAWNKYTQGTEGYEFTVPFDPANDPSERWLIHLHNSRALCGLDRAGYPLNEEEKARFTAAAEKLVKNKLAMGRYEGWETMPSKRARSYTYGRQFAMVCLATNRGDFMNDPESFWTREMVDLKTSNALDIPVARRGFMDEMELIRITFRMPPLKPYGIQATAKS